jgi:zinc transport system permease protein
VCPLVGCFLYVRRTSFYGIALPQFAAAGVVAGFVVLPFWVRTFGMGGMDVDTVMRDPHAAINWHLLWAGLFTFGGLAALALVGRGKGSEIGHVAAAFALASAATILFGHFSATGESFVYGLLRGEILAMGQHDLEVLAVLYGLILLGVVWFHRDLLLVSYDRETARVLGVRVGAMELLLAVMTGVAVSVGTMIFGPVLLFGCLVLPPLVARQWARSMTGFLVLSAVLGLLAAAGGIALAKQLDLPLGPAVVVAAALEGIPGLLARRRLP